MGADAQKDGIKPLALQVRQGKIGSQADTGMQFNAVVASNTRAIRLWESMGFETVGTVPDAFRHATGGPTPVHIMYLALS